MKPELEVGQNRQIWHAGCHFFSQLIVFPVILQVLSALNVSTKILWQAENYRTSPNLWKTGQFALPTRMPLIRCFRIATCFFQSEPSTERQCTVQRPLGVDSTTVNNDRALSVIPASFPTLGRLIPAALVCCCWWSLGWYCIHGRRGRPVGRVVWSMSRSRHKVHLELSLNVTQQHKPCITRTAELMINHKKV